MEAYYIRIWKNDPDDVDLSLCGADPRALPVGLGLYNIIVAGVNRYTVLYRSLPTDPNDPFKHI